MSEQEVFETLKYRIVVNEEGARRYYNAANQLHRIDGPAIECGNGDRYWCQNSLIHRTDGPAIECTDNSKYWYQNGKLHRTDGPAIVRNDGSMEWFINGEELTETEFNQAVKLL